MNGRVYDPLTAQFFSPDPILQAPGDWLNYNRYGYCMGNPFKFTDPSGKSWKSILTAVASIGVGIGVTLLTVGTGTAPALLIAAGILGASASGVTSAVLGTALNGGSFGDCFMAGTKGAIFSGASAMATAGIGDIFGSVGDLGNEILRAGAHATAQGGISELSGGDFWQGAAAGVFGSLGGSAFQAYGGAFKNSALGVVGFSALSGGIGAELSGGDFWQGAATGATIGLFNHYYHSLLIKNRQQAYDEMVRLAEANVGSFHEIACLELRDGNTLILPEKGNDATTAHTSYHNLRKDSKGNPIITIKGKNYIVDNVTHVHMGTYDPQSNNPIYFSPEDAKFSIWFDKPIQILMDGHLFSTDSNNYMKPKMIW